MNKNAIIAVFKRNLASYFGSPSGYVFICAFLLASGLAAFWPQEFFDSNLANLDQLNKYLPLILLGFIPAITMSVWADERRQGTDELLLTLPGSDFDVVLGKYLGAVAIFSASIVISLLANYYVLSQLGSPDFGLLFSTYVGYWFVGLSMLAIGMVASFLTANLTVAFVLGVAFNAPIALLSDSEWGISYNFLDFSRGIISISGIAFFTGLAIAMLYLCSILIGRRHWVGSTKGTSKITHFSIRVVAALVIALGLTQFFRYNDVIRIDSTEEQLSSLSSGSISVLKNLNSQVEIDAFISPAEAMPEQYVQTRINLLTALKEIDRESKNVLVKIHQITPEDNASVTAEKYGVENQNAVNPPLFVQEDGRFMPWQKDLYLGLVFKGNGSQQTIPFLYKGLPVEYEIMRTLSAVSGPVSKKKLGVFATDAPLLGTGGMGIMGFQDALYKQRIAYASEQAVEFADISMEMISYYAISASNNLAEERGRYESYKGSLWDQGILPIDSLKKLLEIRGSDYLDANLDQRLDWESLRASIKTGGMRNSNVLAIAPTATIANITGVSQSIEPTYQNLYVKSNLSGEFTVVNPYLVNDLKRLNLWDNVMVNDLKYYEGSVQNIDRVPTDIKQIYATAFEVEPRWLVDAASRRQKWIDQAQSLNLYVAGASGKKLDVTYRMAWLRGLKTTYYLRALAATTTEKSTVSDHSLNKVSAEPTAAAIPKACSLDDPECEACQ